MKIAILIRSLTMSGGTERQVIRLAQELEKVGHRPTIYAFASAPKKCFPDLIGSVQITTLPAPEAAQFARFRGVPVLGTLASFFADERRAKNLARLIDRDTDILNPHDQSGTHAAHYYKKLVRSVPSVWMFNDLTTATWSLLDDPLFGGRPRAFVKRLIGPARNEIEHNRFFRSQDVICALSMRAADIVRDHMRREARVVRIGADVERISYRPRQRVSGKPLRILCHGIFYRHRRFEDVIRAAATLTHEGFNPQLMIIGDHDHKDTARIYYSSLERLVREFGLSDRVVFAGAVSDEDLFRAYHEADVFVSVAHRQTWGIAVFEALAAGLPVVVSRTIGAAEVLTEGETALLVDPGKPVEIAAACRRLVEESDLARKLSEQGNRLARSFTWKRYAREMSAIFENVVFNHQGPQP